jgi:hypothetical protein
VKLFKGEVLMKPVEKTVVPSVELVSNLNYAQPQDRLNEPAAMKSQLNYMKPEDPPAESGVFQEKNEVVFKIATVPRNLTEVASSVDGRFMT